ncbi:hypothetical protein M427DRAFT_53174 [Gonapodya prolifera JEL478]|uniref:Uncharacterized protein n=1 Tax=Gonapodya prolifera (strain JEL478) TaxID=1344416 RepID=A0A139AR51_GONPJ|nr:hypothetical protein M427DRAFT_53174 [Gonapodya prolifera JEL478]|eukprot:KXS19218.1 hypothetical protein M427DRAFT_53174 [Gonapodya prolifera JEL478]
MASYCAGETSCSNVLRCQLPKENKEPLHYANDPFWVSTSMQHLIQRSEQVWHTPRPVARTWRRV